MSYIDRGYCWPPKGPRQCSSRVSFALVLILKKELYIELHAQIDSTQKLKL